MGGQWLTADCNAVGGMEWQVLLFDTVPVTTVYSLTLHKATYFPKCKPSLNYFLYSNLRHKMKPITCSKYCVL